ncbi:hypothetical protein E4T42_06580 [Aureobasidium subglaciale]|nr:hypothetical protein E4T42_06580 [Aureobasidium subglaciale]
MSLSTFSIKEHTLPCSYIREYPLATADDQEDTLYLAIKQYTPLDNLTPQKGDVTIIAAHANGFPKELYEPLWDEMYSRMRASGIKIRSIWISDVAHQGQSSVLNEDKLGNDRADVSGSTISPDSKTEVPVTLKTTKHQEVMTFMRGNFVTPLNPAPDTAPNPLTHPDVDTVLPPVTPFYRAESFHIFKQLPYLRPSVLYIFGTESDLSAPRLIADKLEVTGVGVGGSGGVAKERVKEFTMQGGGHLMPMERVGETADQCSGWLLQELKRWKDEYIQIEALRAATRREKRGLMSDGRNNFQTINCALPGGVTVAVAIMGRKPNALILEFFERGAKLADQSNRYEHSCKRCGEVFPKGRPDSLTRHLFEKCANITDEDRSRALWQPADNYTASATSTPQSDTDLPLMPRREPSGLDALAEVSRQLQANGQHEEALVAQLRQHMDQEKDNGPMMHTSSNPAAYPRKSRKRRAESDVASHRQHPHTHAHAHPPVDPQLQQADDYSTFVNNSLEETSAHQSPQPQSQPTSQSHQSRQHSQQPQQLQTHQQPHQPVQPPSQQPVHHPMQQQAQLSAQSDDQLTHTSHHSTQTPPQQAQDTTPQSYAEPPAFTVNHGGFGLLQRANKNKVRGRFSEERRKQVQTVRKKGACLRCRMLKKPCSEGTPCGTCQNIESARLWKNACIRSRIAEEFTLYSSSLFHAKEHHTVMSALQGVEPMQLPGRIEVTLFPDTNIYATFPALMTPPTAPSLIFMLNYRRDPDTLAATLERYLHMVIMQCISREPSTFMRSTLEVATELSVDHNDVLLGKLINLWAATNILISNEPIWSIFYEPNHPPVMEAVHGEHAEENASTSQDKSHSDRKAFSQDSTDYIVIYAQLQHAAERYCQKQAKFVMNELERRLLQRQQSSSFLTFLAAVILLNCVERMTGLYHSFDPTGSSSAEDIHAQLTTANDNEDQHPNQPVASPSETSDRPVDWLLEDPPSHYWPQGSSFSNLLHLLLRMRGLPPATLVRHTGTLVVIPSSHNKAYSSETSGPAAESQLQLAAAWIERTNVSAYDLLRAKDRAMGELGGEVRNWDLRFIAALLLPMSA